MKIYLLTILATFAVTAYQAAAQSTDSLVDEKVQLQIDYQEIIYLQRTGQITPDQFTQRNQAIQQRSTAFNNKYNLLSSDQQHTIAQQVENRYDLVFPPIQDKWNAKERQINAQAQALSDQRAKELETDALAAAQLQTDRTFLRRYLDQKTIAPQDAATQDAADLAKISALQNKYMGYGNDWAARFNTRLGQLTTQLVTDRDLKERLSDTTSEVGKDAHRAAEISVAIKRTELQKIDDVIIPAQETTIDAPLKTELSAIQAKYGTGGSLAPSANDFYERVENLTRDGTKDYAKWDMEYRQQYEANLRAAQQPSPTAQSSPMGQPRMVPAGQDQPGQVNGWSPVTGGSFLLGLLFFFLPPVVVALWRTRPEENTSGNSNAALQLPDALRQIKIFKKQYSVFAESGQVYEKELWTETNVTTTTTGGSSYIAGNQIYSNPATTSTSVNTTVYNRYWIRTPDGREQWRRFTDRVFQATKGQVITTVESDSRVLMAFNHSTGNFAPLKGSLNSQHELRTAWMLVAVIALLVIWIKLLGGSIFGGWLCFTISVALFSALEFKILKTIVQISRRREFERNYLHAFRTFLQTSTPELLKSFPASHPI